MVTGLSPVIRGLSGPYLMSCGVTQGAWKLVRASTGIEKKKKKSSYEENEFLNGLYSFL